LNDQSLTTVTTAQHANVQNTTIDNGKTGSDKTPTTLEEQKGSNHIIKSKSSNSSSCRRDNQQVLSVNQLRHQLCETSKLVVVEGEKNVTLALDLIRVRDDLKDVKEENRQLRLTLLHGINNDVSNDVHKFMNIPLNELLRLRLQEFKGNTIDSHMSFSLGGSKKLDIPQQGVSSRSERIEGQIHISDTNDNDIELESIRLKQKLSKMMDTSRREREIKLKLERDLGISNERVEALSEHIEKLMIHLKHEATSKVKALSECSRCRKEIELFKRRNQTMEKRNNRKNRVIDDLKEGAKILEDQLTLMDEKYMELRMKLDWTRTQTERVMRKKEEEIKDLRSKLLLAKQDLIACRGKKKVRYENIFVLPYL
jgi:hypothetical protein